MVNALISDMPTPTSKNELEYIRGYLRQLHVVRGFKTIYVIKGSLLNRLRENYIKELPVHIKKNMGSLTRAVTEKLDSILWDMKKTDYIEANLTPFILLYSLWLQARAVRAVVVFARCHLLSPILHLSQILTNDRRDFMGNLADDIELWFFSHFADVHIRWPFFVDF